MKTKKKYTNREFCICAAIKLCKTGVVILGHRHDDCYNVLRKRPDFNREAALNAAQGFITSRNRFVDRIVAMQLQRAASIPSKYSKDGLYGDRDELFSEDLYSDDEIKEAMRY